MVASAARRVSEVSPNCSPCCICSLVFALTLFTISPNETNVKRYLKIVFANKKDGSYLSQRAAFKCRSSVGYKA